MSLMFLPLALCSKDDDPKQIFEPIEINLSGINIDFDDTSFQAKGFNFNCFRAESTAIGTENEGVALWHPDQNSNLSYIELDLLNITGISKISIELFNNCSQCLDIQILNGAQIITEIKETELQPAKNLVEIDIVSEITALRISSAEAIVYSIKLE